MVASATAVKPIAPENAIWSDGPASTDRSPGATDRETCIRHYLDFQQTEGCYTFGAFDTPLSTSALSTQSLVQPSIRASRLRLMLSTDSRLSAERVLIVFERSTTAGYENTGQRFTPEAHWPCAGEHSDQLRSE